jgi:hypothetical protein
MWLTDRISEFTGFAEKQEGENSQIVTGEFSA